MHAAVWSDEKWCGWAALGEKAVKSDPRLRRKGFFNQGLGNESLVDKLAANVDGVAEQLQQEFDAPDPVLEAELGLATRPSR